MYILKENTDLLVAIGSPRVGVSTHGPTLLTDSHEENNAQKELCTWQLSH